MDFLENIAYDVAKCAAFRPYCWGPIQRVDYLLLWLLHSCSCHTSSLNPSLLDFISIYLFFLHPPLSLSLSLFLYLYICICHSFLFLSIFLTIYPSLYLSPYPSLLILHIYYISPSLYLLVSQILSISLFLSLHCFLYCLSFSLSSLTTSSTVKLKT